MILCFLLVGETLLRCAPYWGSSVMVKQKKHDGKRSSEGSKKNNTYCVEGVPSFGFYLNSSFASVIWFVSLTVKIEIANREKGGRRSGKSMSCCRTEGIVDLGWREGTVLFIDSGRQDSGGGAGQKDSLGIPLNLLCLGITCLIAMWK